MAHKLNDGDVSKQDQIDAELRNQIVTGKIGPGQRLPTVDELEERFNASRLTIMRGLARLHEDGFIAGARSRGTSVVSAPPHLFNYGVAIPFWSRSDRPTPWFWGGILELLATIEANSPRRFTLYEGLDWGCPPGMMERMLLDVSRRRIAGIITVSHARFAVHNQAEITRSGIPIVALTAVVGDRVTPTVGPELSGFDDAALRILAATGKRRVAILGDLISPTAPEIRQLLSKMEALKFETRPYWHAGIPWGRSDWAGVWVHTVFRLPPEHRPDALLIMEEHLTESAAGALAELGLIGKVPVVAHANFPAHGPAVAGVTKLGFDLSKMLNTTIEYVDAIRAGQKPPELTLVPVILEGDFLKQTSVASKSSQ